jgi:L-cysteine:1D-myo-inositol 2-amino-2-deoxy-alpha-D-glucopyranoside ligase
MVALDGEKMSKSKGNLELVSRLRDAGVDPMAIRWTLLGHHYRSDWEWQQADLDEAVRAYARVKEAVGRGAGAPAAAVVSAVLEAMADDLDAPRARGLIEDWAEVTLAGDGSEPGAGDVIRAVADAALGVAL